MIIRNAILCSGLGCPFEKGSCRVKGPIRNKGLHSSVFMRIHTSREPHVNFEHKAALLVGVKYNIIN